MDRSGCDMGAVWQTYAQAVEQQQATGSSEPIAAFYDSIAESYDHIATGVCGGASNVPMVTTCDAFCKYVPRVSGMKVLDVCCGTGEQIVELTKRGLEDIKMVGFDMSASMLRQARARGLYNDLVQGMLPTLPFEDKTFDAVICAGSLGVPSHAPPESLKELLRVTKPGGHIVFSYRRPEYDNPQTGWSRLQQELVDQGCWRLRAEMSGDYFPPKNIDGKYFVFVRI